MIWRCTRCGRAHDERDPPCETCGNETFERVESAEGGTVDTAPVYVWRCPNCGREHVKNTPPCSRCGEPRLEKREQTYDDVASDLEVPGWLAVAKPYAPVIVVLVVVAGLFATGVVPLSALPGLGTPSPPEAPGEGQQAAGVDLEAAEGEVHDRLEVERGSVDAPSRTVDGGLAAFAEYRNRQLVAAHYDEEAAPQPPDLGEFDPACSGGATPAPLRSDPGAIEEFADEGALAGFVANALLEDHRSAALEGGSAEGIDVHVGDDGTVFVYYVAC